MEAFFSALSKRQTMLLLTSLTYGGQDAVGGFDHLPPEDGDVLRHRAQEILQIPREKRIPLLVNEIKRLLTARRGTLWSADPERLASVLRRERPALIEVVLRALPAGLTDEVRKRLPPMKVQLTHDVRPEVLSILRWKLEEALAKSGPARAGFKFSDMVLLKSREVITVIDRMGARALALALAGLPSAERESFLTQLTPDQRQLAQKAIAAGESRRFNEADAREYLIRYDALKGGQLALRNAGAQRVARACLAQSGEFAARMVDRHPGELGRLLARWIQHERPKVVGKADFGRTDIVEQLERLAAKGVIDRPVRLPPPPKQALAGSRPPSALPGGKVLLPPPKARPPVSASVGRPIDPIALREARRAGMPVPVGRRPTPDAIPASRLPAPRPLPRVVQRGSLGRPVSSPIIQKPPVRKPSAENPKREQSTSVQRAPRIVGRTGSRPALKPPGRGPKGGSG